MHYSAPVQGAPPPAATTVPAVKTVEEKTLDVLSGVATTLKDLAKGQKESAKATAELAQKVEDNATASKEGYKSLVNRVQAGERAAKKLAATKSE